MRKIKIEGFRTIYEHSIVSFKNSHRVREGTVVYIYSNCKVMEIEYNNTVITVTAEQITKV